MVSLIFRKIGYFKDAMIKDHCIQDYNILRMQLILFGNQIHIKIRLREFMTLFINYIKVKFVVNKFLFKFFSKIIKAGDEFANNFQKKMRDELFFHKRFRIVL